MLSLLSGLLFGTEDKIGRPENSPPRELNLLIDALIRFTDQLLMILENAFDLGSGEIETNDGLIVLAFRELDCDHIGFEGFAVRSNVLIFDEIGGGDRFGLLVEEGVANG